MPRMARLVVVIVVVVVVVVVVVETNPFVPVFSLVPLCRTIGLPVPVNTLSGVPWASNGNVWGGNVWFSGGAG